MITVIMPSFFSSKLVKERVKEIDNDTPIIIIENSRDKNLKKELETKEYEYGFYTDLESDTLPVGLNEEIIIAISKKKEEPEWMTDWRLDAFKKWKEMKEPEWANVKYEKPDLQKISYYSAPSNKPKYNSLDEVDPDYWKPLKSWVFLLTNKKN